MPAISHLPWRDAIARRLEEKSIPVPVAGCVIWLGALDRDGYGKVNTFKNGRVLAHRAAYELANGEISNKLVIDHLCRVRCCINPAHLEQVTRRVNTLRGEGPAATKARQTECLHGHPLSGSNLYLMPGGGRACLTCRKAAEARYRARKASASTRRDGPALREGVA